MKKTTTTIILAAATTCLLSSCASDTVGVMQPRRSVEQMENASSNVQPNLNHGQHAAGANAINYSNPNRLRPTYGHGGGYRIRGAE